MFAAYAGKGNDEKATSKELPKNEGQKEIDWLSNSSFSVQSAVISEIQGVAKSHEYKSDLSGDKNRGSSWDLQLDPDTASSSHTSSSSPCTPPGSPSSPASPSTFPGSPTKSADCLPTPSVEAGSPVCSTSHSKQQDSIHRSSSDVKALPETYQEEFERGRKRSRSRHKSCKGSRTPSRHKSSDRRRRSSKERSEDYERSRRKNRSRDERRSKHRSRSHSRKKMGKHKDSKYNEERWKKKNRRSSRSSSSSSSSSSSIEAFSLNERNLAGIDCETVYESRTRVFGNLNVTTLSRPAVAWYHTCRHGIGLPRRVSLPSKKRMSKYRYYNRILKDMKDDVSSSKASKESKESVKVGQIQGTSNEVEEEVSKVRAKFNHDLAEDPNNVNLWKSYVQFQDTVHQFERVFRRGGGASGARVTAERKLSILDKALKENPTSEELLKERCQLAESVLPSDKLTSQLKTWIDKDPGNLILWEALIMLSQGSLSTCRVSAVKSIYQQALTNIHSTRRGNTEPTKRVESKLIDLVLHLGLFFRQAGLLELMWSLITVYLEFNLAKLDPTKFQITSTIADQALTDLEEAILGSQLPLPTLWLRVETLRAGTHWVPLPPDVDSEDPQRLVFPEDVNDLIHPINCPHLTFRLVTVTLTLLKVPILPWRECAAEAAGLHPLPWLLDGPEPLLASLLPLGTVEFSETSALLQDASQLVCGPQYLIARPGQDEYLDFLTQVFSACYFCLPSSQQTYLLVWWLRFYRWLMQLERLGHCKLPKGRKKKMRTTAKDLLRQDCNRSNLLLFKEFALLEFENGSLDSTKKVLQGAISALPSSKPVPIAHDRASICALYRTLAEVYLFLSHGKGEGDSNIPNEEGDKKSRNEDRNRALSLLVSLGKGCPLSVEKPSSTDIAAALSKFHHVSREALDKPSEEELDPFIAPDVCHLMPTFLVEWTACHGWLLYLSHSVWKSATMFENVLSELTVGQSENSESPDEPSSSTRGKFVKLQREALFEVYVSLLRHHSCETRGSFGVLRDALSRGLKEFPGNLTLSAALADLETSSSGTGTPLWRLSKMFYEFNSAPAYALFVFVMRYRLKQQESAAHNLNTLLNQGGPDLPDPNIKNRMSTLLKKLTKHPVMRRCPLLWRLRLQFAAAVSNNDAECFSTFYLALEDCPWVKALYMDIVQVLPTQLAQVQDLLVEKELRLHVTPEELEILRVD